LVNLKVLHLLFLLVLNLRLEPQPLLDSLLMLLELPKCHRCLLGPDSLLVLEVTQHANSLSPKDVLEKQDYGVNKDI
jgi:hypothetical protein